MKKEYTTGVKRKTLGVKREGLSGRRKAEGGRREGYRVKGERVQGSRFKDSEFKDSREKPARRRKADDSSPVTRHSSPVTRHSSRSARSTDRPASLRGSRSEPKQPRPRRFNEPRSKDFEDKKPSGRREALSDKREGGRRKAEGGRREGYKVKGERVQGEGGRRKAEGGKRFNARSTDRPASLRGERSEPKQPRSPRRFNEPRSKDFEDKKPSVRREALSDKREGGRRKAESVRREGYKDSRFKDSREKPARRRKADDSSLVTEPAPSLRRGHSSRPTKPSRKRETDNSSRDTRHASLVTRHASREGVRLNKFIANSGICSRREADEYIVAGLVSVNGTIVTEMGVKVQPDDDIRFNNERLKGEPKVYIVMNKPKDFVTTMSDPYAEKTVMDLIGEKCPSRVFPVGRLDKATTGVLLFTNDGELAEQLTHPSYNKKKIYHIFLDKNLKQTDLQRLLDGVELEDGLIQADSISYVDEDKAQVGLEIHSGRNRVVRRMFEALDYKVKKLDRVYFAGLTKKNLKRGQWRFLTDKEVNILRMGSYE